MSIEVKQLCVQISKHVLQRDVSFSITEGSRLAIIGPNGVGKTSLLRCLLGLLPYQQGHIHIQGKELQELALDERARSMAYVPQFSQLQFPVPVRDVVAWSRFAHGSIARLSAKDREMVEHALADFELSDIADQRFDCLSGGEQRRVLLARAAASAAPYIFFDEPTAHLDMHYILKLQSMMQMLSDRGSALVMVLHDLRDIAAYADEVILLGHNTMYGPSNLEELIESGVVQDTYGVSIDKQEQLHFY